MSDDQEKKAETEPQTRDEETAARTEADAPKHGQSEPAADAESGQAEQNTQKTSKEPPLLNQAVAPQKPVKSGRGLALFALLLAFAGIGAAGYCYWLLEQSRLVAQDNTRDSEQRAAQMVQGATHNIGRDLANYGEQLIQQQQLIDELQNRLAMTRRQVGEITHVNRQSWMLAEAEYLLRLANQRIILENETASVVGLLEAADQILVEVDDVNLFPVRGAIARELEALRAVAYLDVEGVFLRLAALVQRAEQLPLLLPETSEPKQTSANVEGLNLSGALDRLHGLVRIRHRDAPVEPLLSPEQHYYVQQNMRLMLEQAQLALLQRKPSLYRQSLEKTGHWVEQYFQLNKNTDGFLASLSELQQVNVKPDVPNISESLALLKGYLSDPEQPLIQNQNQEEDASVSDMDSEASVEQPAAAEDATQGDA